MSKLKSMKTFMEENNFCAISVLMTQSQICLYKEDGRVRFFDVISINGDIIKGTWEINHEFVSTLVAVPNKGTTLFVTKVSPN